jgi:arylsulfatase
MKKLTPIFSVLFALSAVPVFEANGAPARDPRDRPNIIVMLLDDAGYADFSITGHPTIRTPNLERLSREGVTFGQYYCAVSACSASRYSLLTGRSARRCGLGSWVIDPAAAKYIHPNEVTLAEGLRQRGYATAVYGKWHLGTPNANNGFNTNTLPLAHGFDEFYGLNVSADYVDVGLYEGPSLTPDIASHYRLVSTNVRYNASLQSNFTREFTDRTVNFIRAHTNSPFFVYLPLALPHLPLYPNADFAGKSRRGTYGDIIEEIDYSLGRILAALQENELTRHSIVHFTSDNGPWVRYYTDATERLNVGDSGPFRDGKGSGWEGGFRVPGLFWWPDTIPAGRRVIPPASTMDLLPTFFQIAGAAVPVDRTIDGRDIRSLLAPGVYPGTVPEFKLFYTGSANTVTAVRKGPWKLHATIFTQTGNSYGYTGISLSNPLLFNLEQDIGERFNVRAAQSAKVLELQNEINAFNAQAAAEGTFWN